MENECDGLYSANQIRERYKYHTGGWNPPSKTKKQVKSEFETCAVSDLDGLIEAGKKGKLI